MICENAQGMDDGFDMGMDHASLWQDYIDRNGMTCGFLVNGISVVLATILAILK